MRITHKAATEVSTGATTVSKCDYGKIHLQAYSFGYCQSLGSYRLLARDMFHRRYESFHRVASNVLAYYSQSGDFQREIEREGEKERERERKRMRETDVYTSLFHGDLISKVTSHYLCHILLVRSH